MTKGKHPISSEEKIERGWMRLIRPKAGPQECLVLVGKGKPILVEKGHQANTSDIKDCETYYRVNMEPYLAHREFFSPSKTDFISFTVNITIKCRVLDAVSVIQEFLETESMVNKLPIDEIVLRESIKYEEKDSQRVRVAVKSGINSELTRIARGNNDGRKEFSAYRFELEEVSVKSPLDESRSKFVVEKKRKAMEHDEALGLVEAGPISLISEALAQGQITPLEALVKLEENETKLGENETKKIDRNIDTIIRTYDAFVRERPLITNAEASHLLKSLISNAIGMNQPKMEAQISAPHVDNAPTNSDGEIVDEDPTSPSSPETRPDYDTDGEP